jgi:hypothetical protein
MSVIHNNYTAKSGLIFIDADLPLENDPFPDLLTISKIDYVIIPDYGTQPDRVKSNWVESIERYKRKNIIAVINQTNFLAIKEYLSGAKTYSFDSLVVFPTNHPFQRTIYTVEINGGLRR